jgi:hypothetical protein
VVTEPHVVEAEVVTEPHVVEAEVGDAAVVLAGVVKAGVFFFTFFSPEFKILAINTSSNRNTKYLIMVKRLL